MLHMNSNVDSNESGQGLIVLIVVLLVFVLAVLIIFAPMIKAAMASVSQVNTVFVP